MDHELMAKLSNAYGVSGFETEIKDVIKSYAKGKYDEMREDALGNLVFKIGSGNKRILIESHMDEVGLIVKYVDENGFAYVAPLGGLDPHTLLNQRFKVITSKGTVLHAVCGSKPVHLQENGEEEKIKIKDLFLDFGVKDKKELKSLGIDIGEVLAYDVSYTLLGKGDYATGKALDNRTSCYALLKLMDVVSKDKDLRSKYTFYFAFTTQEEVGLKGARVVAFSEDVDYAIVVDTSPAGDVPGIENKVSELALGKGVVIDFVQAEGRGLIMRKDVVDRIKALFEKEKIPYQIEIGVGGVSNAAIVYITRQGIPTIGIGVAVRYLHTPTEVVSVKDMDLLVKSLELILKSGVLV